MNRKELIIKYIREKLDSLQELGKVYSEEKINLLAENLAATNKTLTEVSALIDNKFSSQIRKIRHNNQLASLKEYYLSSIDKLKKGNNCYLLSYDQGVKVLEQAYVKEIEEINPFLKLVNVNNRVKGYKKDNSVDNDYELIMSDIAFLLNIPFARTYRVFDDKMEPQGIINLSFVESDEKFLNLEDVLKFVKEESPKFTLVQELVNYHDKNIKHGLKVIKELDDYKKNFEYIFKLFEALPDVTDSNIKELKADYLRMKIFELLTNSLNNNLNNFGLMVNKDSLKYTYRLSPSYNKVSLPSIGEENTICNFFIVNKKELLNTIINSYYDDVKGLLNLIFENKDSLFSLIDQVIKEHLEYSHYNKYHDIVMANINLIVQLVSQKRLSLGISDGQMEEMCMENDLYHARIAPFLNNYVGDMYEEERGSTIILGIVTVVLFITIGIILLTIYAVSKMQM